VKTKNTVSLVLGTYKMKTNIKDKTPEFTHGGAKVSRSSVEAQLVHSVLANMLWEDEFYEDGVANTVRLQELVKRADPSAVQNLALRAREDFKLRHTPLFLLRELARNGTLKANVLTDTIQRADEIAEFLAIYWKDGKTPISNQVKKGLANAFGKFNEYQLAKWDKNSAAVSLRDVMFLVHANPKGKDELFKKLANKGLKTPDTWETNLSAGANKKETFTRLMAENKLGALAFLRNLRNMTEAGIPESEIREYAKTLDVSKVLPFRYIAAWRIIPQFSDMLEDMMMRSLGVVEKLPGRTLLVVDISGSMNGMISAKSELSRIDAAKALTILAREVCEDVVIYATAGNDSKGTHATMRIPPLHGFALGEYLTSGAVRTKLGGGGIFLTQCIKFIEQDYKGKFDRVIVFTDEQDCSARSEDNPSKAPLLSEKNYILNVGSYRNGINSGKWETITGFSEATLDFIREYEKVC